MATLQKIRNRAGILVATVIGLALFAFILGDMLSSGQSIFNRKKMQVAVIDGKAIDYQDYVARIENLTEFYQMNYGQNNLDQQVQEQIKNETWSRVLRETIMDKSYAQLGIEVSPDELKTMVTGEQGMGMQQSQPHPIIMQMFSNPETGEFNRALMLQYFAALDNPQMAQEKKRWLFIENEIVNARLNEKYLNLVRKGLQPSALDVQDHFAMNGKSVDFSYIAVNYSTVPDEEITVSESELAAYYKAHKENYKQAASRSIQYVSFDVVPSAKDEENARFRAASTKIEFTRVEDERVTAFVAGISEESLDNKFYAYNELPASIRDSVFNATTKDVFGPYFENNSYKLSRLQKVEQRPDSVRARHILVVPETNRNMDAAKQLADSIMGLLNRGADFAQLAARFSADEQTSQIGGDLGWFREGQMITEFNDACFTGKKGSLQIVETRYGYHIIRIDEQSRPVKKVQVATIVLHLDPSDETYQDYYSRAVKFRGASTSYDKFVAQARELGMDPRVVPDITADQTAIPGLDNPREVIRWAYNAEKGDVSNIFDMNEKYVVAVLTEAHEEGYADMEEVKAEIEMVVRKDKKAEKLIARLAPEASSATTLFDVAGKENMEMKEATQVRFANAYITGVGMEPLVVGASMELPVEKISKPLKGETGVYVIDVTNRTDAQGTDMSTSLNRLKYNLEARTSYEAYNALIDAARVVDNRIRFF